MKSLIVGSGFVAVLVVQLQAASLVWELENGPEEANSHSTQRFSESRTLRILDLG